MVRCSAALAAGLFLAGCAGPGAFEPKPVTPFGTPYEGLDASSYGPRSMAGYRACDPQDGAGSQMTPGEATQDWVQGVAYNVASALAMGLGAPIQASLQVDTTAHTLGLLKHFRVPGDSNHPAVAVLSHNVDAIVFWHSAKIVRLPELGLAATAYCKEQGRAAAYRGSASRCPPLERGLAGTNVISTWAISAYACTPQ